MEESAFCVAGEQCEQERIEALKKQGCVSLSDLIEEPAFWFMEYYCIMVNTGKEEAFKKKAMAFCKRKFSRSGVFFLSADYEN